MKLRYLATKFCHTFFCSPDSSDMSNFIWENIEQKKRGSNHGGKKNRRTGTEPYPFLSFSLQTVQNLLHANVTLLAPIL